jgi:hypothetical protein
MECRGNGTTAHAGKHQGSGERREIRLHDSPQCRRRRGVSRPAGKIAAAPLKARVFLNGWAGGILAYRPQRKMQQPSYEVNECYGDVAPVISFLLGAGKSLQNFREFMLSNNRSSFSRVPALKMKLRTKPRSTIARLAWNPCGIPGNVWLPTPSAS